jgi:hypothetical protein
MNSKKNAPEKKPTAKRKGGPIQNPNDKQIFFPDARESRRYGKAATSDDGVDRTCLEYKVGYLEGLRVFANRLQIEVMRSAKKSEIKALESAIRLAQSMHETKLQSMRRQVEKSHDDQRHYDCVYGHHDCAITKEGSCSNEGDAKTEEEASE